MGKSEDAFDEAKRRIAEAKREDARTLDLRIEGLQGIPAEIGGLTGLTGLYLSGIGVSDLTAIAGLAGLTWIDLSGTGVSDLTAISALAGLTRLYLTDTGVSDLTAISGLPGLTWLDVSRTEVADLTAISGMTGLTRLDLSGTGVSDLTGVSGLTGLTGLYLSGTGVADLTAISGQTGLKWLDLAGTGVTDLTAISRLTGLTWLDLSRTGVLDLTAVSGLTGLTVLDLSGTGVADLRAIAGLTGLRRLRLSGTGVGVADFKRLAGLERLVLAPDYYGLRFDDTAATKEDSRVAEISRIEDPSERARALFEYLGIWVPREAPPADPLLPVLIEDGKLEIAPSLPAEAERAERLKQVLHERLRPKAQELAQKAGNEFPKVASKGRVLGALLDRPFEELDLLSVHLEIEDLNVRAGIGSEDDLPYSPDVVAALGEVTRLGPGLTRGNADVELFHERLRLTREGEPDPERDALRAALSAAILAMPEAHGPLSLALEARISGIVDPDVARTLRDPKQHNMLWRLAVTAAVAAKDLGNNVASNVIAASYGAVITTFVSHNWALLQAVAATYGVSFAAWIGGTVGLLVMGKGVREKIRARKAEDDGAQ